jgi:hypothetical protein
MTETTGNGAEDIEPDNVQTQAFSEAETASEDNLSDHAFSEAHVSTGDADLDVAAAFLEKVLDGNILPEENVLESLSRISTKLQKHREHLSNCRTRRLWLQCLDMVAILRRSIKAERTGNFELHLQCVKDMLPYFAGYRMVEWRYTLLMEMLTASSSVQPSGKLKKNPLLLLDKTQTCLFCSCSIPSPHISTCFFASGARVWDITTAQAALGADICTNVLFGHAIGGCDTTSSLFSMDKREPLLRLKNSKGLWYCCTGESLNTLRCFKYLQKLSTSKSALEPKTLPPTASAAQFHSLLTYFQVQVWLT